ncbi:hypothetical protein IWW55_004560 [Coemansia sp. RSA 2706]|nr:hypothetical protein IWW55_004560 [Coemansia sp. RSA 2706]
MCPASLYSYFDAQQLADFIMNSQLSAYDGTSTAAGAVGGNDSAGGHPVTIGTAFAGVPEDYEGYDNARARKRRMTVSDERRTDDMAAFHFSDAGSGGLLGMLDQPHSAGVAGQGDIGSLMSGPPLSSLPIPPGSEAPSLNPALTGGMAFGGMSFQHSAYVHSGSGSDCDSGFAPTTQAQNPLSPPATGRTSSARKHQSLSIAIGRDGYNE